MCLNQRERLDHYRKSSIKNLNEHFQTPRNHHSAHRCRTVNLTSVSAKAITFHRQERLSTRQWVTTETVSISISLHTFKGKHGRCESSWWRCMWPSSSTSTWCDSLFLTKKKQIIFSPSPEFQDNFYNTCFSLSSLLYLFLRHDSSNDIEKNSISRNSWARTSLRGLRGR